MFETSTIFYILSTYGYLGVFFGIIIGGEILLLAAGMFISLGYLNVKLVIIYALLGIIFHDIIFYILGRYGRKINFLKTIGKKFISKEKIQKFENSFQKHSFKTILFIRFIYGFRAFVLMTAGFSKMNFSKFILIDALGSFLWTIISLLLGYFFAQSFSFLKNIIKELYILAPLVIGIFIIIIFLVHLLKKKLSKKF